MKRACVFPLLMAVCASSLANKTTSLEDSSSGNSSMTDLALLLEIDPIMCKEKISVQEENTPNKEPMTEKIVANTTNYNCPKCNCSECPKKASPQIPYGFKRLSVKTRDDDKYLIVIKSHDENLTWNEARLTCLHEGAFLAYPTNAQEIAFYKNIFPTSYIWIGVHDYFQTGQFTTTLGEEARTAVYMNWGYNQPDNQGGNERCVQIRNMDFNDVPCSYHYPFICKIKLPIDT